MNFDEYYDLSYVTAVTSEHKMSLELEHSVMGLFTELGEVVDLFKKNTFYDKPFDTTKLVDEVGDVLWYFCLYLHARRIPVTSDTVGGFISQWSPENKLYLDIGAMEFHQLTGLFAGLLTCMSSPLAYSNTAFSHYNDEDGFNMLGTILSSILFHQGGGASLELAAMANIAKLKTRYPDGFTEYEAIHRDKQKEAEAQAKVSTQQVP